MKRVLLCCSMLLAGCNREYRDLRPDPPHDAIAEAARESELQPGVALPTPAVKNPYDGNAYAISEGRRLYGWYNCAGCHANGGGAIGPPLMDSEWIYGGQDANIFETIVKGRPNGMPSFGGHIPKHQVWQLVAYVKSLSNNQSKYAIPARADHTLGRTAAEGKQ